MLTLVFPKAVGPQMTHPELPGTHPMTHSVLCSNPLPPPVTCSPHGNPVCLTGNEGRAPTSLPGLGVPGWHDQVLFFL